MASTDIRYIKTATGVTFRGCTCLESWWPIVDELAKVRGLVHTGMDVTQGCYSGGVVKASGGTHDGGGAMDVHYINDAQVLMLREAGAAAWHRRPNWDGRGGSEHVHLVLNGCPHNGPARYQVNAYLAGYDGLGYMGQARRDPDRRPDTDRTWSAGIDWCRARIQEEAMLSNDDKRWIADQINKSVSAAAKAVWDVRITNRLDKKPYRAASYLEGGYGTGQLTHRAVLDIAKSAGLSDEQIAKLTDAMADAVAAGLDDSVVVNGPVTVSGVAA